MLVMLVLVALSYACPAGAESSVKELYNNAKKASRARDYRAEIGYLEQLASEHPGSKQAPVALYKIAEIYRARLRSPSEAMRYYDLLIEKYPSHKLSRKALKLNAKLSRRATRNKAPSALPAAPGAPPRPGMAQNAGGGSIRELLRSSKKAARARDYNAQIGFLTRIAAEHPGSKQAPVALYRIAETYRARLRKPSEAMAYYDLLIDKYPSSKLSRKALQINAKLSRMGYESSTPLAAAPLTAAPLAMAPLAASPPGVGAGQDADREPPSISITSPALAGGRASTDQKQLTVTGRVTDPSGIVELILNGKEVSVDESGSFQSDMYLIYGKNDLSVAAMDGEGNRTVKNYTIVRKGASAASEHVLDIDKGLPSTRRRNSNAIAVVIGNREYQNAKNVDYAVNDAKLMKTYLVDVLGYKVGNIFYYENASKSDFEILFGNRGNHRGKLFNSVKKDKSDVFIYYSGHGAPGLKDKKGYFVPSEADPQYIELSGYPTDVFYDNMAKVPARSTTIVLEACFSGATIFENISPMVLEVEKPALKLKNAVVLSSSSGSQVSSWYNDKEHGMFTYFFLKAIHNRNADANKDKKLTYDEIYKYVSDNTEGVPYQARRIHGVEQNPTIEGQLKDKVFVTY